ncbi:hypothetical protein A2376_00025 [Candidatus Woesebacteria bacterium RIFOXYB1_FULL_47_31]|uniref:Cupin fold metalloprotein WbuC cupin domain-containing protein n=3 Tax=Candidatus Woeseibacteriota TaxID=1752722 RepID=A0A1F8D525_9BACT|nr:MAG: hypothetical protein A2376_00025 [Candidatus Woesebacteria bacterium RIFOXYB1_FULL_47_31]OGM90124.1 MAG: hypothetical protein A2597_02560 [Candidatus Woesebacteria bacterium RIFOXYD1_FULL_46_19]
MNPEFSREAKIGVSVVDTKEIKGLTEIARSNPEKRATITLDRTQGETLHKQIDAILPETYLRPHSHINPQRKTLVPLGGIAELVTFSDEGEILQKVLVGREIVPVVEVEANTWYTLVALSPFLVLEIKVNPTGYDKGKDEVFAPWAPEERTDEADIYFESLRQKLGLSPAS